MNKFLKTTMLLLAITTGTQAGKFSNSVKYVANHKTRFVISAIALANLIEYKFSDKKRNPVSRIGKNIRSVGEATGSLAQSGLTILSVIASLLMLTGSAIPLIR